MCLTSARINGFCKNNSNTIKDRSNGLRVPKSDNPDCLLPAGVLRSARVTGLVVAGGDTAFDVLRSLGASSVDVLGEVEAGVPYGLLNDGIAPGVVLVTKAGGFGDSDMLTRALEFVTGLS